MARLSYRDAGVDIEAGERLVDRIKSLAASTHTPGVLGSIGGFAGLLRMPDGLTEPVLVAGTDGVGTKLKVAFELDRHESIGIDLVAMSVNDVVTVGATPLLFLDYLATSRLDVPRAEAVVRGIANGCRQADCALLGGETAELPGFYRNEEYDLAGFCVGVVERRAILDGTQVQEGDALVGVASSGLHSNGFSLARKALLEVANQSLEAYGEDLGETLGDALLTPTRIYARAAKAALATGAVHALSHITGGGIVGNLPRVLPEGLAAQVNTRALPRPAIFDRIQAAGNIAEEEMQRTFNLGVGLIAVVQPDAAEQVVAAFAGAGETAARVGRVTRQTDEHRIQLEGHRSR